MSNGAGVDFSTYGFNAAVPYAQGQWSANGQPVSQAQMTSGTKVAVNVLPFNGPATSAQGWLIQFTSPQGAVSVPDFPLSVATQQSIYVKVTYQGGSTGVLSLYNAVNASTPLTITGLSQ